MPETSSSTPNIDWLRERARRLLALLDDPHPGLFVWQAEYGTVAQEIAGFWAGDKGALHPDSARLDWLERSTHVREEIRNLAAAELGDDVVDGTEGLEDELEDGEEARPGMTFREMIDGLMGAEEEGS